MKMDKDSLICGIEGLLRRLNFNKFILDSGFSFNIDDIHSTSDVSKIKSKVKQKISKRFNNIVDRLEIDATWLSNVIDADTVEGIGKLPVSSLKYLNDDLVLALTNHCTNLLVPRLNLCILPYNTSVNRFLILYLFTYYYGAEIRERLCINYDDRPVNILISNGEIGKACNTIREASVFDGDIKNKYREFLKELYLYKDDQNNIINDLLIKFRDASYDEYRQRFFEEVRRNVLKGICFITCDGEQFGITTYTIGIICGGYHNTIEPNSRKETPFTDWEIWSDLHIFSFIQSKEGKLSFKKDNVFIHSSAMRTYLSNVSRIAEYGNINNSFKAYLSEVSDVINKYRVSLNLGSSMNRQSYNKFITEILNSKTYKI